MKTTYRFLARTLTPVVLAGACASLAPACSDDTAGTPGPDGGGGAETGGAGGGSAGKGSGGSSGKGGSSGAATGGTSTGGASTGGKPSTGGGAGTHGDASVPDGGADASADAADGALSPEEVLCADAGTPASALLVGGSRFCAIGETGCTTSEVAAVDLGHGCVLGRTTFADSDTVPRASGGHGFVLERSNGALSVMDLTGNATARVDLHPNVDGGDKEYLNPHDVVYARPASGPAKAYVSLYGTGAIAIVDLDDAAHGVSFVDLSSFKDASDTDGSPDPDVGFYDATKGRVYFVLQRSDLNTGFSPPYIVHCPDPSVHSLLIALDVATNQFVDLNDTAAGVALPLSLANPADVAVDTAGRRALLLANGCGKPDGTDGGLERALGGVESVNLDTLATQVLYTPASQNLLSRLVLLGSDSALLQSFDDLFSVLWNKWAPSSTSLGASLTGVPDAAVVEGTDSIVGVLFDGGRPRVARYKVSTQVATTVVQSPWVGNFTFATGVALVK